MAAGTEGRPSRRRLAFARAARIYWLDVFPLVRRELSRWRSRADAIPAPQLRSDALLAHRTKSDNSEGLAALAVIAPKARRPAVVRAAVAFQVILDYLDTVSEQAAEDSLANSLQLHRAFSVAVDVSASPEDYYASHAHRDDDGYLAALVATCQEVFRELPSYAVAREALDRCARFLAQGQSLNHALLWGLDDDAVAAWARESAAEIRLDTKIEWWEMAAAGSSTLPIGALMAAAADPATTEADVAGIEVAYFPWIAALSTLLDCLVDLGDDAAVLNQLNRFGSEREAAEHVAAIASRSLDLVSTLRDGELHEVIVAAIGGYYLAKPTSWLSDRHRIATEVLEALGAHVRPALLTHCLRRGRLRAALRVATGGTAA